MPSVPVAPDFIRQPSPGVGPANWKLRVIVVGKRNELWDPRFETIGKVAYSNDSKGRDPHYLHLPVQNDQEQHVERTRNCRRNMWVWCCIQAPALIVYDHIFHHDIPDALLNIQIHQRSCFYCYLLLLTSLMGGINLLPSYYDLHQCYWTASCTQVLCFYQELQCLVPPWYICFVDDSIGSFNKVSKLNLSLSLSLECACVCVVGSALWFLFVRYQEDEAGSHRFWAIWAAIDRRHGHSSINHGFSKLLGGFAC